MHKWIGLLTLLIIIFNPQQGLAEKSGIILDIHGPIGPATQDYVERGLKQAVQQQAKIVILEINTPGGLESAMRGINEAIIASPIPVITYVAPSGARAASAGTYILYASHLAYMAPGTNLGAATPIAIMPGKDNEKKEMSTAEKKAIQDAAAYLRGLAQLRNKNVAWAEKAVREGASLSANEAKELKVIDNIVSDYPQLLQDLHHRPVTMGGGSTVLDTKDLTLKRIQYDWRYRFLNFLTNPTIAYFLMLIAFYGIFFELSNPGLILPGVAGIIALFLVLYAFQLMTINYVGLILIFIGLTFMILEFFVPSFGVLAIGGLISFIIGSVMLFDIHGVDYQLPLSTIITMSVITGLFIFFVVKVMIQSFRKSVVSGSEGLMNQEATVLSVNGNEIQVSLLGERWKAKCSSSLRENQKVRVTGIQGLLLIVEPLDENSSSNLFDKGK